MRSFNRRPHRIYGKLTINLGISNALKSTFSKRLFYHKTKSSDSFHKWTTFFYLHYKTNTVTKKLMILLENSQMAYQNLKHRYILFEVFLHVLRRVLKL